MAAKQFEPWIGRCLLVVRLDFFQRTGISRQNRTRHALLDAAQTCFESQVGFSPDCAFLFASNTR
jgi:hypothetical protein